MKIVLFHPARLPPMDYGGVERVVLWLAKGLLERGHEVSVGAFPGSTLPRGARLIEVNPNNKSAVDFLDKIPKGTDVIHFMAPPEEQVWNQLPCAGILTVHGNGKEGERFPKNTVFLSRDHAQRHGSQVFVYNGIDPEEYLFNASEKDSYFLFLSKTSWKVKNVRGAIRLCSQAKSPLTIAGGSRPIFERLKVLFSPQMRWVGAVNGREKARLLAGARALLFPVLWPEPFGLVVVEALMSGTPVIASPYGSLSELVPPHVGVLIDPEREPERWIDILQSKELPWSREACREWALEKFDYKKMAEGYEFYYRKLSSGVSLCEERKV